MLIRYFPCANRCFDLCFSVALAGGSGICAQLWKYVFRPEGVIHAALDLLRSCPSCSEDDCYVGGCPACIQAGECMKFNDFLCKESAFMIGQHLLKRLEKTELYKTNMEENKGKRDPIENSDPDGRKRKSDSETSSSPRRRRRQRAMRVAKDIESAQRRQTVVGRPSWPMDGSDGPPRHQQEA